jgi:hypothetical protein
VAAIVWLPYQGMDWKALGEKLHTGILNNMGHTGMVKLGQALTDSTGYDFGNERHNE